MKNYKQQIKEYKEEIEEKYVRGSKTVFADSFNGFSAVMTIPDVVSRMRHTGK